MEISKIWLMDMAGKIMVLVEVNGKWYRVIRDGIIMPETTVSHCVHLEQGLPSDAVEVDFSTPESVLASV